MNLVLVLLKGFSTSSSLIIAIGAQNAFVIKQGLKGEHLLLTALICSLIDACLIFLGVNGFGKFISEYPLFLTVTHYLAVVFLISYGIFAMKSVFKASSLESSKEENIPQSGKRVLATLLTISLLNPHVYLDTVILLGSIASQQPLHDQLYFAIGAVMASFAWFFSITFGARFLAPLLQKKHTWRIIDGLIALTMWGIALSLMMK